MQQQIRDRDQIAMLTRIDVTTLERELTAKLDDWKGLLRRQTPQARQVLKKLLCGPVMFAPKRQGTRRYYDFGATIAIGPMLAGTCNVGGVPRGFEPGSWP